jgi:thiol:disulfide interchange protein DsbC
MNPAEHLHRNSSLFSSSVSMLVGGDSRASRQNHPITKGKLQTPPRILRRSVFAAALLSLISVGSQSQSQPEPSVPAGLQDAIFQKFPGAVGAKVEPAFPGFYSVAKGNEIIFLSADLKYLINGDVREVDANRSITEDLRVSNRPRIDPTQLDVKDAIKMGAGARKLYVFADPDCPFCRQLEKEMATLKDVTIYVFPMPLDALHPNARRISESIWCSINGPGAWRDYLIGGKKPAARTCANPLDRNIALAQRLGISGTPALIFSDGELVPGAIAAARIDAKLNSIR